LKSVFKAKSILTDSTSLSKTTIYLMALTSSSWPSKYTFRAGLKSDLLVGEKS